MNTIKMHGSLKLKDYERKTSRFILFKFTNEEALTVTLEGYIALGRSIRERHLWEQVLVDDLIICLTTDGNHFLAYAYQVLGKGIKLSKDSLFPEERPFQIFIQLLGTGSRSSVKSEAYFYNDFLPYTPRAAFQELWKECQPVGSISKRSTRLC